MNANEIVVMGDSYRLVMRVCNKPVCKCHQGMRHGPYWYKNGSTYIGKKLPDNVLEYLEALKKKMPMILKDEKKIRAELEKARQHVEDLEEALDELQSIQHGSYVRWELTQYELSLGNLLIDGKG